MDIMKKISFLLLFALLLLAGCSSKSPGEVAVLLFNSITEGNVENVKENIHFSNSDEYDVFCEYLDMVVASDEYRSRTVGYKANYQVVSETVNGETAEVVLAGYTVLRQRTRFNVQLVKVNGEWKVNGDQSVLHGAGR